MDGGGEEDDGVDGDDDELVLHPGLASDMAARIDVQEVPQMLSRWAACSSEETCAPHWSP